MKNRFHILSVLISIMLLFVSAAYADEDITPDEVIQKCQEASKMLQEKGEAGLSLIQDKNGPFTWKGNYVWVAKCGEFTVSAHPFAEKLIGKDNSSLVDKKGNYFFMQLCDTADQTKEKGGWVEYWWPKKGVDEPVRKVAYILQVPGTPYQVSAGIYSETVTAADLNAKLK